ncbi:phage tail tape measure protein [Deinococcus sp. PEB2-63]
MTKSDAPDTPGINLGSLTADVVFNLDEMQLKRALDAAEARLGKKIEIPVLVGGNAVPALRDLRAELDRVSGQTTKVSREQAAASRSLEAQYRAAGQAQVQAARVSAAESAAAAAKTREQAAAYTLQARMAAQAARDEKVRSQATTTALENEQRAYRNLWQARQLSDDEVIEAQRRIYQQALLQAQAVDKQSDAYRRLTQVAAGAQRTIDAAQGINTPGGFSAGITQGLLQAVGNLGPFGQLIEQIITSGMQAAEQAAQEGARDVAQQAGAGLQAGLATQQGRVRQAAVNLAQEVQDGAEDALDIRSPSRVMRRIGAFAGDGLRDGLLSKRAEVAAAAKTLANAAEQNATPTLGAVSGGAMGGAALPGVAVLPSAQAGLRGVATQAALATAALGGTALAAGAVSVALVNGTQKAAAYQQGLAEISTLTNKMPGDLDDLGRKMLKLGVDTRRSFADLKAGYEEILGASVRGTDSEPVALQFLERSAQLARVTREETKVAADALTSILNAYELDATSAARVTDMLWASISAGKVRLGEISGSLGAVAGQAKSLGVPLEELLGAMALLTTRGIPASTALEYIRSALSNVQKPSEQATKTAKALGIEFSATALKSMGLVKFLDQMGRGVGDNSQALATLIGDVGGLQAVIGLLNGGLDDTGGVLDKVTRSTGELDRATAKLKGTAQDSVAQFNAAWERTQVLFNGTLLSSFTTFLEKGVNPLLIKLGDLKEAMNNAATPAELHATLQITAKDDGTTAILKFLLGAGQQIEKGFNPANNPALRAAAFIVARTGLGRGAGEAAPTNQADITLKRIQPQVGEGPLLPGQQRAVQQATDGIVQALGMAGKTILNEFGVSGKDYHHDGAVRADATHNGIDFGAPRGTPILAPFAGQISTRQDARNGKVFELVDALGNKLVGIHLDQFDAGVQEALRKGGGKALILKGEQIGTVGNTGTTAGSAPHLHLMGYRAGSTTPVDARSIGYAGLDGSVRPASTNTTRTATTFVKKTDQALIAEARRILDRIEAATKAGDVTGKVKAEAVLKAFTDSGPRAAAALEIVRNEAKGATQAVSQYGQTFDKLKGQLDLAGSTFKLNDDAQGYVRSLDAISKAAQTAASSEKAKNGETAKYRALLDLAGDAAGKARQQREGDDRAAQQASDKAAARAKEQAQLRARYAAQARDLEVSEQQATLARVRTLNSAELDAFKGTQAQRVALIKRQAADEANAREQVARAVRDTAVREAQNAGGPNMGTVIEQARQAYRDEVQAASLARDAANRAALAGEAQAVRQVRDAYGELATGLREKIRAGQVDEEALAAYRTRVDELATSARAAGVAGSRFVTGAQASAEAVYQLAIDAQVASGAYADVGDSYDRAARAGQGYTVTLERALELLPDGETATDAYVRALEDLATQGRVSADTLNAVRQAIEDRTAIWQLEAEQIARVTTEGLGAADALAQVGDTEGAIDTLYGTLDDLYTRLENGEDVAAAIGQVVDRLTDLGNALELDTEFGTFVAGLGGMIDDQIAQVVDKIADPATSARLAAKLKVFLADLRGQLPTYADPYAAGLIPGGNGFAPQVQDGADLDTITRARDLGTLLAETVDPAALQGVIAETTDLLASEAGKALGDGTRQGLEDGVKDAQTYLGILSDLTEEAVVDGWERGTRGALANPTPTNEFTSWAQKIFDLGAAGLNDPTTFDGLTQSLDAARASGELTIADLQNLLALIEQLKSVSDNVDLGPIGRMKGNYDGLLTRGVGIEQAQQAGELDPIDAATQLRGLAKEAERYAAAAQAAGDTELAGQFRQIARGAREAAGAMGKLMAAQEVLDWTAQLSGAFGGLAGALGEVEQEYDSVTGEKLSTPWKDLAANLDGAQNAAKKLGSMITDVMRIMQNPADIGAWVSLITNVVSSIADAIAGFQKAQAEVTKLKQDFAQDNPLLNPGDYQKAYTRSRGFLADVFGGGPEVVNEIDKIGVMFAKTLQDALIGGIKTGMVEAIKQNDFSLFKSTLRESTFDGLLSGMVDAFLKDEILKSILAPAIKAWSDALKTPDPADDAAALAGIDAAISQVDQQAERFYTDVAPKFMDLQQRWGIDPAQSGGASGSRPVFGNAPDVQYGAPPRVLFPPEALLGFTAFGQAVPEWRAGVAEWRQINAEFRQTVADLSRSRPGGLQPLSGGAL